MTWIWRNLSLPEALLILEHAERRLHAQLALSLSGQQLAGASAWSKDAGKAFVDFCATLRDRAQGRVRQAKKTTRNDVAKAFASLGIPVAPN